MTRNRWRTSIAAALAIALVGLAPPGGAGSRESTGRWVIDPALSNFPGSGGRARPTYK